MLLEQYISSLAARAVRRLPSAATYADSSKRTLFGSTTPQPNFVRIVEVGPRDGLQNEKFIVPTEVKVELIDRLQRAGIVTIEAGSFVSPKWVPQMAGTAEVLTGVRQQPSVRYPVLVPNMKGLSNLLELLHAQSPSQKPLPLTNEIAIFTAASDAFSQANTNMSIAASLDTLAEVTERAMSSGLLVRGYISCVDTCPFQGRIDPMRVKEIASKLKQMGCYEISLGDTVGTAVPATVTRLIDEVTKEVDIAHLAGHYHDTYGMGTANVIAAVSSGIRVIDIAGLGGCPYSPGATGNVATEDVNHALTGVGYDTNVDMDALVDTGQWISQQIGRVNESRAGRAWIAKRERERHGRQATAKS